VADVCSAVVIVDNGQVVLHGDVAQLRGASPVRFLDIEFATPNGWAPDGLAPGATVTVDDSGRRHRVELAAGTEPDALVSSARAAGDVLTHRFGPPDLSEVFRRVVRR